jgi:hypothetical protein
LQYTVYTPAFFERTDYIKACNSPLWNALWNSSLPGRSVALPRRNRDSAEGVSRVLETRAGSRVDCAQVHVESTILFVCNKQGGSGRCWMDVPTILIFSCHCCCTPGPSNVCTVCAEVLTVTFSSHIRSGLSAMASSRCSPFEAPERFGLCNRGPVIRIQKPIRPAVAG